MLTRVVFTVILIVSAPLAVVACGENNTVSGTITFDGEPAIPEGAVLEVELRDVSYQDAAAPLIANQTIASPERFPVDFAIPYDPDDIDPAQSTACRSASPSTVVSSTPTTRRLMFSLAATPGMDWVCGSSRSAVEVDAAPRHGWGAGLRGYRGADLAPAHRNEPSRVRLPLGALVLPTPLPPTAASPD